MKSTFTSSKKFEAGRPAPGLKINRKKFSSDLTGNYSIMLQIYYLNKVKSVKKKDVKYFKISSPASGKTISKHSFSITARIASFFTFNFAFLKKVRQGITLVTE